MCGSTIKDKDGKLIVLRAENLHAGWDAQNSITHEFEQELCDVLDEQVAMRNAGPNIEAEGTVCQIGAPSCCSSPPPRPLLLLQRYSLLPAFHDGKLN